MDKSLHYTKVGVDSKLDLLANEVSIDFASEFANGLIQSLNPAQMDISLKLGGNQLRHFNIYPVESSLNFSVSENEESITSSAVCHDISYKLKRSWYRHLYLFSQLKNDDGTFHIPTDENNEPIPFTVTKDRKASQILKDALAINNISLNVVWEAENYSIINIYRKSKMYDTDISSLISELISPIQFSERYSVYTYIDNDTIYIRKLKIIGTGSALGLTSQGKTKDSDAEYNIDIMHIMGGSIKKELSLKPSVSKVIVEYRERKLNAIPITSITTDSTYDKNGTLMAQTIRTKTELLGILINEKEELYRAFVSAVTGLVVPSDGTINWSGMHLFSSIETIYTYDIAPEEKDSDGLFQSYRLLKYKNITEKYYTNMFAREIGFQQTIVRRLSKKVITSIAYGYDNGKLKSEIETSEHYLALLSNSYGVENIEIVPFKTTKSITTHKELKGDLIEIRRVDYVNDEEVGSSSTIGEGKLQESSRAGENDADSQNYELKYLKVSRAVGSIVDVSDTGNSTNSSSQIGANSGEGASTSRIVKLSNELLSKEQLIAGAHEILGDGSHIKISLDLNLAPMMWIPKGATIKINGILNISYIDKDTNEKEQATIDFDNLADTPFILESQQYTMDVNGNSLLGTMSLIGYKYF